MKKRSIVFGFLLASASISISTKAMEPENYHVKGIRGIPAKMLAAVFAAGLVYGSLKYGTAFAKFLLENRDHFAPSASCTIFNYASLASLVTIIVGICLAKEVLIR